MVWMREVVVVWRVEVAVEGWGGGEVGGGGAWKDCRVLRAESWDGEARREGVMLWGWGG